MNVIQVPQPISLVRTIPMLEESDVFTYERPKSKPKVVTKRIYKKPLSRVNKTLTIMGTDGKRLTCYKGHKLTEDNIYSLRSGKRRCKTCHLNKCNEYKLRKENDNNI